MERRDPEGLKKLLEFMGFKVTEEGEDISAFMPKGKSWYTSGGRYWVDDVEEILNPADYGCTAKEKRYKIIFTPC